MPQATFQRLMTKTIGEISSRYGNLVLCYVDDVLIATTTVEQHLERLHEVFNCLRKAGLKLKAKKCKLMEKHVKFLGRVVSEQGLLPDIRDPEKVRQWKVPTTKAELESFIGFASYYREFIDRFADIVAPLNQYKGINQTFGWDEDAQHAFETLRDALTQTPALGMPDDEGTFLLETAASEVAISSRLRQWQMRDGKQVLTTINHASKGLKGAEKKYSSPKAEMLAALTFMEHNKKWLMDRPFILRCDILAFSWLKEYSTRSEHVARWIARLEGFHITIEDTHNRRKQEPETKTPHDETPGLETMQATEDPTQTEQQTSITHGQDTPVTTYPTDAPDAPMGEQDDADQVRSVVQEIFVHEKEQEMELYTMPYGFKTPDIPCPLLSHEELQQPQYKEQVQQAWDDSVAILRMTAQHKSRDLAHEQQENTLLRVIKDIIQAGTTDRANELITYLSEAEKRWLRANRGDLTINEDGILGHMTRERDNTPIAWTIVLPAKYHFKVMRIAHDLNGHRGINKTKQEIKAEFSWPGLDAEVELFVKSCRRCQRGKGNTANHKAKLRPITSTGPNDLVEIDFENLCVSTEGHKGLLVAIDHWSKYLRLFPVEEFTAEAACNVLFDGWIQPFGAPNRILSDQGSQFESALFKDMLTTFGIDKSHGCAYRPQTQGLVERSNQTIAKVLRCCMRLDQRLWHTQVHAVEAAYNQTIQSTTKYTPDELFLCHIVDMPLNWGFPALFEDSPISTVDSWLRIKKAQMEARHSKVQINTGKGKARQEKQHNKKTTEKYRLRIGDMAYVFSKSIPKYKVKKLHPLWHGPVRCTGVFNDGLNYTFDKVSGNAIAHHSMVKRYLPRPGEAKLFPFTGELQLTSGEDGVTIIEPANEEDSAIDLAEPYEDENVDNDGDAEINENYIPPDNAPIITIPPTTPVPQDVPSQTQTTQEQSTTTRPSQTSTHRPTPKGRRRGRRLCVSLAGSLGDGSPTESDFESFDETITDASMSRSEPSDFDIPQSDQDPHSDQPSSNTDRRDDIDMEKTEHDNTFSPYHQDKRHIDSSPPPVYPQNFDDGDQVPQSQIQEEHPELSIGGTEGLSREDCGIVARRFGRPSSVHSGQDAHSDQGSPVFKEQMEIHLDHEYGIPLIQPALDFGALALQGRHVPLTAHDLCRPHMIATTQSLSSPQSWGSDDEDHLWDSTHSSDGGEHENTQHEETD